MQKLLTEKSWVLSKSIITMIVQQVQIIELVRHKQYIGRIFNLFGRCTYILQAWKVCVGY